MDDHRFDDLAHRVAARAPTRRNLFTAVGAAPAAFAGQGGARRAAEADCPVYGQLCTADGRLRQGQRSPGYAGG